MIFRLRSAPQFVAEVFRALYARLCGYHVLADAAAEENRLEKCFSCPELDEESEQCRVCGCFVRAKVMVAVSRCPRGKWGPIFVRKGLTINEK